ncbi:hypothetical protein GCM10009839_33370 [Catenulispora yoronensis]|uniref:Uncharacterized protein n=1 Tax=Catenulispora yoronensis TaxID=450799 RepID=A0ABN2U815_9ACTN
MSIEDLQHRISAEPGRLSAPPAPVETVIGRARAVRARRRATGTAALAVVAVAGVATPVLAGVGPWRDGSAVGGGAAVSVNPPKVDKQGGTVFSGSADGKKWSVSVAAGRCATDDGDLFGCLQGWAPGPGAAAELASTFQTYTSAPIKYRIRLRPGVARADVDLTDGERLSLTPAKIVDTPMAAFEVPRRVGISRVTAYGADGRVVAYSIAYQSPTDAQLAMWYRPDETPTQPVAAGTITATVKGVPANVEVHTGPFGICYTIQHQNSPDDKKKVPNTTCQPLPSATTPAPPTGPDRAPMGDNVPSNAPWWVALGGLVGNGVDHVDFALSTGTFRASTVRIGGFSFAVCIVELGAKGFSMVGRTFYDASGHVLTYEPSPVK